MARWLKVRVYAPHLAVLNGPGAGRMYMSVKGRPPMWSRSLRGYTTSEKTAGDVVALADRDGYRVEVHDYRGEALVDLSPQTPRPMLRAVVVEPAQLDLGLEAAP